MLPFAPYIGYEDMVLIEPSAPGPDYTFYYVLGGVGPGGTTGSVGYVVPCVGLIY